MLIPAYSFGQEVVDLEPEMPGIQQKVSPDSVKAVSHVEYITISAVARFIINVYEADAKIGDATRQFVTILISQRISQVIKDFCYSLSRQNVIKAFVHALVALVLTVLFIKLLSWIFIIIDRKQMARLNPGSTNLKSPHSN